MAHDTNKRRDQNEAFRGLITAISQVMMAIIELKNPSQESKRHYMQYCQVTTLENILLQRDLFTAFPRPYQGADGQQRVFRKPILNEEEE